MSKFNIGGIKVFTVIMCAIIVLSAPFIVNADTGNVSGKFSDVKGDEWFSSDLSQAASLGLITGYTDGTFKQERTITFAEFLTASLRAEGIEVPASTGAGANVKWYDGVVDKAVSLGVLSSKYELVDYNIGIPREKMAEFTCKILGIPPDNSDTQNFIDVDKYDLEHEWINATFYNYLTDGVQYQMGKRKFGIGETATRSQLAAMVMRIEKYSTDKVSYMQTMKAEFEALETAQDKKDSSIGGYVTPDGKPFIGGTLEPGGYLQYTVTGDLDYKFGHTTLTHQQSVDYLKAVLSSKFSSDTARKIILAGEGTITPPTDFTRPASFSLLLENYKFVILPTGGDAWTLDVEKIV